jgi:NAD(P)H-hydrate epimerase
MQRAAAGLADEIHSVLDARGTRPGCVLVVAGPGNNGGDALYAGAELATAGSEVRILTTGRRVHEGGLAAAVASGASAQSREAAPGSAEFDEVIDGVDVVVDGILGTGSASDPALRGRARAVVEAIRPRVVARVIGAPVVVAVDLPSGTGADDGSVPDPVVLPAVVTVTFGAVKAGLLIRPASALAGRLRLVDIGLDLTGVTPLVSTDG